MVTIDVPVEVVTDPDTVEVHIDDGENITVDIEAVGALGTTIIEDLADKVSNSRTLTAGAGLTGGGDLSADRTFNVGAGTGITVNADDVALDTSHVRNAAHPASSTDHAIARYDSTAGALQNSSVVIDDSDNVLLGATSAVVTVGSGGTAPFTPQLQVHETITAGFGGFRWSADAGGARLTFSKSRGASAGTHTVVQSADALGQIVFTGSDGTNFAPAAMIHSSVDGTPGNDDMPGRIVFSTTADGANAVTERVHLDSAGALKPASNDGAALGTTASGWSDLHVATGFTLNAANGDAVITHSSGIWTVSTGDLRVTTPGTDAASVVTVGGTQTLTDKSLTSPVLTTPSHPSYADFTEISSPANPSANSLRVFAKDVAGETHLLTRNSAGTETDLSAGGGVAAATQVEMEAASSTSVYASPGRMKYGPGVAKAWAFITVAGGTPTLQRDHNISGITDKGVGDIRITYDEALSADYAATVSAEKTGATDLGPYPYENATTFSDYFNQTAAGAAADPVNWNMIVMGDL